MKKLSVLILLISLLFSGCSYGTDVENQAFVIAVGIDKGEYFPLKLTFVFANPGGGSSGGEGKESSPPKPDTVTVEAPTVFSAVRKIDSIKSKVINLSHVKIVVFSENVAHEGIKKYLTGFASSRDFRPNTYVCVTTGEAEKYLRSVKPSQETFIEKYYDNIMHKVAEDKVNEAYLYYLYFNFMEDFSGSLVPLAGINDNKQTASVSFTDDDFSYEARAGEIIRDAENPAEILGCAVFRNDRMLGTLGSFHTDLARIICNEYYPHNYSIYYPESNDFITFRLIQQKSPTVKTKLQNQDAFLKINVPVSIEYVDAGKIENDKDKSKKFCSYLEDILNKKTKELIKAAQTEYNADILGLGETMKRHFSDIESWKEWNWEKRYENAVVSASFVVEYADFEEAN